MKQRLAVNGGINDGVNVTDSVYAGSQPYDALNRPVMWENTGAGNPSTDTAFARSNFQYDALGRETASWRNEQNNKGERFNYDATNQLSSVYYNADQPWTSSTPANASRSVSYNQNALNRNSVNDNGVATSYTWDSMNQYSKVGSQSLNYDFNFNLASYAGASFTFNAQKRLVSVSGNGHTASFIYDGLGRCLKRTIDGMVMVVAYDGWKPILEWDGAGNFQAYNIYGPGADEILWRNSAAYGVIRYHTDSHGNVMFLLNNSGAGIEKYTYDVFGQPTITSWTGTPRSSSAVGNRFMFQGHEYLSQFGFYDFRNRAYLPKLGRFLQIDPINFGGGDYNLYRFIGGDPINCIDPSGLDGYTSTPNPGGGVTFSLPLPRGPSTPSAGSGPGSSSFPRGNWGAAPGQNAAGFNSLRQAMAQWDLAWFGALNFRFLAEKGNDGPVNRAVTPDGTITSTKITVDFDGSPGAYAPLGSLLPTLDILANATKNLKMNGPLDPAIIVFANGQPVITPNGYYVSSTTLSDPNGDPTNQSTYINGSVYPYVALGSAQRFGAKPGDYVGIRNNENGAFIMAVYGDYHGGRNIGIELSPASLQSLGVEFTKGNVTPTSVTLFIYSGSNPGGFPYP